MYPNLNGSQKEGGNFLNLLQREGTQKRGGNPQEKGGRGYNNPGRNYEYLVAIKKRENLC